MSDWPVFGSEAGPRRESNPCVADSGPTLAILGRMSWQTTKPDQQISTRFSKSNSLESFPFEVKKPNSRPIKRADKPHDGTRILLRRGGWGRCLRPVRLLRFYFLEEHILLGM